MFSFLVSKKNRALAIYQDFTSRYIMMIICNGPSLPFAMSALLGLFAFDKSLANFESVLKIFQSKYALLKRNFVTNIDVEA